MLFVSITSSLFDIFYQRYTGEKNLKIFEQQDFKHVSVFSVLL